jgi:tight adherence protein B
VVVVTTLAAACGALVGLGVFLALAGLRGVVPAGGRPPRSPITPARRQAFVVRLALGTGAAIVVLLATRWVVGAVLAGALGAGGPTLFGGGAQRARAIARIEAIAAWTEMLRDVTAAGAGLQEALAATAPVAPAPIRTEAQALAVRLERDRLVPALLGFADAVADPMADLVVAALVTAATEQTRRLSDLLGTLAQAIRDQAAMRLRVEAGRARTRATAKAVAAIALAAAVGFVVFDRGFLRPYDTALGQVVIGLIGACFAGAFWLLARMGRPATPPRLLPAPIGRQGEGAWA